MKSVVGLLEYWHAGWRSELMSKPVLPLLAIASYSHGGEVGAERLNGQFGINPYLNQRVVCRLR
jgi:hypothetical protein